MELVKMKCPSCQANLELNPALKEAFCEYCGSKILLSGMQSSNILGQPVADAHLLEMLKVTGPILTRNKDLETALSQKTALLQNAQNKLAKIKMPFVKNNNLDFFKPQHEKPYLLGFVLGAIWAVICLFVLSIAAWGGFAFFALFLFGPAAIGMFFLYKGTKDKQVYLQTIAKTQQEINAIQQELNQNRQTLSKYNIEAIPAKYRSGKIFNFFTQVLSDQRATNVSQAINLYENELRTRKMEAMQQQQLAQLTKLSQENAQMRAQLSRRK